MLIPKTCGIIIPMKTLLIPFGPIGRQRKDLLFRELIRKKQGPPYIYNDVLIIVPSARMRRTYARMFQETGEKLTGSPALVLPEIQTLHQFLERLSSRMRGPVLIDENSRLVLIEGIVKKSLESDRSFSNTPVTLAPSLSAALANMMEQLSSAGVTSDMLRTAVAQTDFADRPQVALLADVFREYEQTLSSRGIEDLAFMRSRLAEGFDPSLLARYSQIIIDGIHAASEPETRILRKLASLDKCLWLIEAPSPEILKRADESHPMRMVKDFIMNVGLGYGEVAAPEKPEDRFLSEIIFSDMSFSDMVKNAPDPASFEKRIDLLSAVNMREEVSLIAGEVKRSLLAGASADHILVAFPSLDEYGPLAEEIFTDYGIPYNRALGRQLSSSPVATSIISLLNACKDGFSGASLMRIFGSPFIKFAATPETGPALDRFMRSRRILGGKHRWLASLERHAADESGKNILAGPIKELFSALDRLCADDTGPLTVWMKRLSELIDWAGIRDRVSLIKGPLNANLQAYKKLLDTLASLSAAGRMFPEYAYTFSEWLFMLKKTLMHARYQVPPEDEAGVQILGLMESAGHAWDEIYLGGLVDGKFPQRQPQNIFLPEATLEALGVRPLEKARLNAAYNFYRLLLSAGRITLTYPEAEQERPTVPSPFLAELAPLREAGIMNRYREKTAGLQFSLRIKDSMSMPELAKAAGRALHGTEVPEGLTDILNSDVAGMPALKAAAVTRPSVAGPAVPEAQNEYRITDLDIYLNCPYDYYITKVLGLAPLEEVTEDISPQERGSRAHAILKNFYDMWKKPVTPENRGAARAALKDLAERAFAADADTFRNRREKDIFINIMAERFLNAETEFWKKDMRPEYLELKLERHPITLSDGGTVYLNAKIDRIDVDRRGNYIIVDYKTGRYPEPKKGAVQDIFQLPIYAVMARSKSFGNKPQLKDPVGLAYYGLKGSAAEPARDTVLYNEDVLTDQPALKPLSSPKKADEFEAILRESVEKAKKAVEGIRSGRFPASPANENKCRYCPNELMCEGNSKNGKTGEET